MKQAFGKSKELIKAGATRFGTHTLVGERLQELKSVLQQTVVDPEYIAQNYADRADEAEVSNAETRIRQHKGGTAKKLVLDDSNDTSFWSRLAGHVDATMPIYKLLRRHDSSAPSVGKAFHGWFEVGEPLKTCTVSYTSKMVEMHSKRWEYGDVPFFSAAYVLDPEFINHKQNADADIMSGFMDTVEKIAILAAVRKDARTYDESWKARAAMIAANHNSQQTWTNYPKYATASSKDVKDFCTAVNTQLALYRGKKGVFAREWVIEAAEKMPAYLWWEQFGASTPELQMCAMLILSQPASASICERINSEFAFVKDRYANIPTLPI